MVAAELLLEGPQAAIVEPSRDVDKGPVPLRSQRFGDFVAPFFRCLALSVFLFSRLSARRTAQPQALMHRASPLQFRF
jgi:hypothetical protein